MWRSLLPRMAENDKRCNQLKREVNVQEEIIKKLQAKLDVEVYRGKSVAGEFQKKINELTHENEKLSSDLAASKSSATEMVLQGMLRQKIRALLASEEERAEWDVDQEVAQWIEK